MQASPEHPDILTNLSATAAHSDFLAHSFHSFLNIPPPADLSTDQFSYIPSSGDIESYVPSLPTGWSRGGVEGVKKAAPVKEPKTEKKKGKPRHKLPKGAVPGKPFSEDVRIPPGCVPRLRLTQRHLMPQLASSLYSS